jgi:hypothetical protein
VDQFRRLLGGPLGVNEVEEVLRLLLVVEALGENALEVFGTEALGTLHLLEADAATGIAKGEGVDAVLLHDAHNSVLHRLAVLGLLTHLDLDVGDLVHILAPTCNKLGKGRHVVVCGERRNLSRGLLKFILGLVLVSFHLSESMC